jgi:uncharacterized protein (TIGR02453 family)
MLAKASLQFLDDLKAHNNRDWFLDNKKRYEIFKKDYQQLVADFLNLLKPLDPSLAMLEVKNCTFRINRDIRFSKDKSPYKSHLSIWFSSGVKGQNRSGYYVHLEKGGSFIAGGIYAPEANDLKKIRKEIAFFQDDLEAILDEKQFKSIYGSFDRNETNTLKNAPKDFEKDHPAIELLKLKSFTVSRQFDSNEILENDFVPNTVSALIVLKPLNDFINRALTANE